MDHPKREIIQANAMDWLGSLKEPLEGVSIITSLPDFSEFSFFTLQEWKNWFEEAAQLCLTKCDPEGLCLFYQTDIKVDGEWIDKSYLCMKAAEKVNSRLLSHKVVGRLMPGMVSFGRPGYSHLLVFSKNLKLQNSKSTADILPHAGKKTWTRGMGVVACEEACSLVQSHSKSHTILDPFCGHGSVLAVANRRGLNSIGIELSKKRAKLAQNLRIDQL